MSISLSFSSIRKRKQMDFRIVVPCILQSANKATVASKTTFLAPGGGGPSGKSSA